MNKITFYQLPNGTPPPDLVSSWLQADNIAANGLSLVHVLAQKIEHIAKRIACYEVGNLPQMAELVRLLNDTKLLMSSYSPYCNMNNEDLSVEMGTMLSVCAQANYTQTFVGDMDFLDLILAIVPTVGGDFTEKDAHRVFIPNNVPCHSIPMPIDGI